MIAPLVSFLPAFWLLVPGALGLIAVTQYLYENPALGMQGLLDAVVAIVSIAVGVLCGYPLVGSLANVYHQVARRGRMWPNP